MISKTPFRIQQLEKEHHGYDWPTFAVRDAQNHCLAVVGDVDRATAEHNEANAKLFRAAPEMLKAIRRAVPWIGKLIAGGVHQRCVAPNDAIGTLQELEAILEQLKP